MVLRDGISEWVAALAVIATVCEAFALEVRHGQRTEVRELWEPFGKGQKGSSAMPHKKNPIVSERIAGMARIVRAQVVPVHGGHPALARARHQPLLHRAHRAARRVDRHRLPAAPDDPAGRPGLVVDPTGCGPTSSDRRAHLHVGTVLLELVEAGLSREDAYSFIQAAAMGTWGTGTPFRETLHRARPPRPGSSSTRPGSTRCAGPSATSSGSAPVFDRLAALT